MKSENTRPRKMPVNCCLKTVFCLIPHPQAVGIEMFQDEIKFCQIVGNLLKNALHHRRKRVSEIKMAVEDKDLVLLDLR